VGNNETCYVRIVLERRNIVENVGTGFQSFLENCKLPRINRNWHLPQAAVRPHSGNDRHNATEFLVDGNVFRPRPCGLSAYVEDYGAAINEAPGCSHD